MNENARIYGQRYIKWDMTKVTYIVTWKLSHSLKDKRCDGLLKGCET